MSFRSVSLGLVLLFALSHALLTPTDVAAMERAITNYYGFIPQYGAPCNPCTQGDNIGALVRLMFHDAFGGGGLANKGGMNGCIDFATADNNGLQEVVGQLNKLYPPFSSKISKADFWLLAANTAIKYATTAAKGVTLPGITPTPGALSLPFRYGRQDDLQCSDKGLLPKPFFSWQQMTAMFIDRIGLNVNQFTALLGAHGLGRAQKKNSGVEGGWTLSQSTLSNGFYQSLGVVPWTNPNKGFVWMNNGSKPSTMMLRIDIEPLYSPATSCPVFDNFTQGGKCHFNHQSGNPSGSYLYYANNIGAFFANFTQGWQVLSEFNYHSPRLMTVD
jgi:hypothetical protein